ncbi:MAG TPA: lipoate--protein ligase family protein [Candidatus Obscuribacterales bacterium]
MLKEWNFIPCSSHDGFANMAIDEALLESHLSGNCPPVVRLYKFAPPAVTIGLSQKMAPDVVASIEAEGIDVVRRPTGGRAVLHLNDLTYSFVGTDSSLAEGFLSTSVTQSYKEICAGLLAAFRLLGVESELGSAGAGYRHLQDCFMATTGCDLHHRGTKLIGSAQVRRRGGVLQHGSVPLDQDPALMSRILKEPTQSTARHHNLFDAAGRVIPIEELEQAFKRGFEEAFGVRFKEQSLSNLIDTVAAGTPPPPVRSV